MWIQWNVKVLTMKKRQKNPPTYKWRYPGSKYMHYQTNKPKKTTGAMPKSQISPLQQIRKNMPTKYKTFTPQTGLTAWRKLCSNSILYLHKDIYNKNQNYYFITITYFRDKIINDLNEKIQWNCEKNYRHQRYTHTHKKSKEILGKEIVTQQ